MSKELADNQAAQNTDREIWREREGDYYADSIHVTDQGRIGINCGGTVIVKPVREWHKEAIAALRSEPVAVEWEVAMRNLVFAARTTGGTAGPDEHLKLCCDDCEEVLAAAPSRESRTDRQEPGLSAERVEEWREWWHNMPYKDGEIAQVNQICDAALSSLRGTFADGIEAAAKVCDSLNFSINIASWGAMTKHEISVLTCNECAIAIRALAQGQRTSEQDADELPVHVADALIHQIKSGASFDRSVMLIALGQLRAHLSRKEPK